MKTLKQKTDVTTDVNAHQALEDAYALIDKVDTYIARTGDEYWVRRDLGKLLDDLSALMDEMGVA